MPSQKTLKKLLGDFIMKNTLLSNMKDHAQNELDKMEAYLLELKSQTLSATNVEASLRTKRRITVLNNILTQIS